MESTQAAELAIPNVRIEGTLGRGGFGVVHRGRHLGLDVEVAVKVLDADAGDPSAIERALAEARLMAKLDHPNVLRIHDAGRAGSAIYLVLEIMDGGNCSALRRVSPARGLELARQLLAGIQALHEARIIHRDIKPANCLLRTRDGRVKLADLGIAVEQLTREGLPEETAGTLPFMAPELFEQPPRFGVASDLYALGMTLACLFLEDKPYPSGPIFQLLGWIRGGDRPRISSRRPDMPHELTSLVDRLLAIDPSRRPSSASEALASLGKVSRSPSLLDREAAENPTEVLGPWIIGAPIHESMNWSSHAVSHSRTGAPGRLSILKPMGPIANSSEHVLASADRASRLDHPGILDVIDWGLRDGQAYLVTLPLGRPLHSLVESGGPIDEAEAVSYAVDIAEALTYLHAQGLVYQIVDANTAVISPDARTAQLGWPMFCRPIGSPSMDELGQSQRAFVPLHAAPEAFEKQHAIEAPGDVYGLGETLYYLLAGTTPYPNSSVTALWLAKQKPAVNVRERNPMVTAPTARLIASLLDPDPARRPTASAAVAELGLIARRLRRLRPVGDPT